MVATRKEQKAKDGGKKKKKCAHFLSCEVQRVAVLTEFQGR